MTRHKCVKAPSRHFNIRFLLQKFVNCQGKRVYVVVTFRHGISIQKGINARSSFTEAVEEMLTISSRLRIA